MKKEECFMLGYIARRSGNNGELNLVLDVDEPRRYAKLESFFAEINDSLVPFFIRKISIRGNNATVHVEGIDDIAAAENLLRKSIYLPLNMLPPLKGKKFYFHEMPGYTVTDAKAGDIGTVTGILDFPQQAIFQIMFKGHEILIPAKDEFIDRIDRKNKVLYLKAPEGLIDLYTGGHEDSDEEKETDTD